ncbi:MAG: hypothetical protein COY38_02880 [Candidatus Aenigmarchaeota archaeon CG_4_10_14_0_8_um_filter_37_24]|nr:hypothetical protein [Candidatus Aenigmarchaeota archaeon]OIN86726.1 MAG: hypothetical protein AUJ50_03460 [Candidatus Aenigmarchaeota archaeon CG1_02_38_14]PIV68100.1 MAG: hypothetical protein COS07_05285 [Candidatus Aenigmarchaeota archaeon CG01_land_8_20_14_3_00_37_9]PIW40944.1 MAG: hypothetical protein COW21_04510 [Candidatus Aenigmarchaeota archaeon CG15_BIG_FIL_POST_REV_8_21_14_020_37_27]PIX50742.1 MAG: hypothetical protein COZ52_02505 [Candidatus Aenigmarchaeota archaeon CG_4_8_14_3_u
MELEVKNKTITLNGKVVNNLDRFVLDLVKILEKYTDYVIVSGYVAIFFGRSRATEDIDIIIKKSDMKSFLEEVTANGYWIINTPDIDHAIELLDDNERIRISKDGQMVPNVEIKYPEDESDSFSLKNKIKINFDGNYLFFSPLEIQIAYKLKLGQGGNQKDIEDAVHLFKVFKGKIDTKKLKDFIEDLSVHSIAKKYFGEIYDQV